MWVVVLKGSILGSIFFITLASIGNELHYVTYDHDAAQGWES